MSSGLTINCTLCKKTKPRLGSKIEKLNFPIYKNKRARFKSRIICKDCYEEINLKIKGE